MRVTCVGPSTACRWRSSWPRPGHRTLSVEEITRRLDDRFPVLSDPTSRRPERRRALEVDHRAGATSCCSRTTSEACGRWRRSPVAPPGGRRVRARRPRRTRRPPRSTSSGRLASRSLRRSSTDDPASRPVRYRLLDSIRAFALEAMRRGRRVAERRPSTRPRRMVRGPPRGVVDRRCAQRDARPSTSPSREPNGPTSMPPCPGAPSTTRCVGAHDLPTASAGPGSSSATAVGAQRITDRRSTPPVTVPIHGTRADALLLAGWIEASTGHLEPARRHVHDSRRDRAGRRTDDVELQARCRLLPRLRRLPPRRLPTRRLELTDREPRARTAGLDRPWDQAANWLVRRPSRHLRRRRGAERRAAADVRPSAGWAWSTTRGCTCAARRCSASWPGCSTASTTPSSTSRQRRRRPRDRLGFQQTEAYQVASLGRAQCQAGDYEAGAATLASRDRQGRGHRVTCAWRPSPGSTSVGFSGRWVSPSEARTVLGGRPRHGTSHAGGGEQAALGDCLLAALDAADGVAGAERSPHRAPGRRACSPMTRPSRSSPVMRWPASPSRPVTSSGRGSSRRRPSAVWKRPPTSSPSAIGPTPRRSGDRRFGPLPHPLPPLVQHQEGRQPDDHDGDAGDLTSAAASHPTAGRTRRPPGRAGPPGRCRSCRSGIVFWANTSKPVRGRRR